MSIPDWWWKGMLLGLGIFLLCVLLLGLLFFRWARKQVDELNLYEFEEDHD